MIGRRSVLTGLLALVAAPAIVRPSTLMKINSSLVELALPVGITLDDYVERILKPRFLAEVERRTAELQREIADCVFAGEQHWPRCGLSYLLSNSGVTDAALTHPSVIAG